jgi:glycosyltransferase involved in cell wall biosynthesis
MKKATLVMPVLNEIEGMKLIMPRIKSEWIDQIICIDGNSTDGTLDYIKEHNYGLVPERIPGLRHAVAELHAMVKNDIIITFSPDGNCIPELIPELIKKMEEGYDMVIASRYYQGAKSADDSVITRFGNWLFPALINFLHGGHYTDIMSIYRAYRKDLLIDLDMGGDSGYSIPEKLLNLPMGWEPLMTIRAAKRKLKVADISGDEPARIVGTSKLRPFVHGAAHLIQVFTEIFIWR